MSKRFQTLCWSTLFLLVCTTAQARPLDEPVPENATAVEPEPRAVDLPVLLDPEANYRARRAELDMLMRNAKAGHHPSICTLGRLALQGTRHPAELPRYEYGDAKAWINRCVLGGDLDAMLVMAEAEIAERRGLEAMIWVQAYLKLAATLEPQLLESAAPYKAGMLARIEDLYRNDRPSNEEVLEYVAGFLDGYGERISKAYQAGGQASWLPLPAGERPKSIKSRSSSLSGRFTRDMTDAKDELTYAVFVVEVAPNGKPDRILVLESWPDAEAARSLKSFPISRRYNAVESEAARWTFLPVYVDNKAYSLLPKANARQRPPTR
jgi:hypothetical protein